MEEARYYIELGPGGRSKVYHPDGRPVENTGSCDARSESNQEDGMTVSEALERIDELREEIARLGGDELAENRGPQFMPTKHYAESDGDGEDGEATNEASGTEGASASGGFMEPTPYHEDN